MNLGLDFFDFTFWVSFRHLRLAPDGVLSNPKELRNLWKVPKYISSTCIRFIAGILPYQASHCLSRSSHRSGGHSTRGAVRTVISLHWNAVPALEEYIFFVHQIIRPMTCGWTRIPNQHLGSSSNSNIYFDESNLNRDICYVLIIASK